jgi:hypothetical protein
MKCLRLSTIVNGGPWDGRRLGRHHSCIKQPLYDLCTYEGAMHAMLAGGNVMYHR